MNIRIVLILPALLVWPALLYGQEPRTITMTRKPIVMGQRWSVKSGARFDLKNNISNKGQVIETVTAISESAAHYKARALAVDGTKLTSLAVKFGEVWGQLTNKAGKTRQDSPIGQKQYTVQLLRDTHYFKDKSGELVSQKDSFLVYDKIRPELDWTLQRHSLIYSLPQRPLKIGESFPIEKKVLEKLLGSPYQVEKAKLKLTGTKLVDGVSCATFELSFHTSIQFANGVIFNVRGKGEVCSEIATSLHRSVIWEGAIIISGSSKDAAGNTLTYQGTGKMAIQNVVTYPFSKKAPPAKIARTVPKPGQTWKESFQRASNIVRKVFRDGEAIFNERATDSYSNKYTVKVLETTDKTISKAEVTFGKVIERQSSPKQSETSLPMSNKSFTIQTKSEKAYSITNKAGSKVEDDLKKSIYKRIKELFKEDRSEFLQLFPRKPLAFGKVVTVDPKAALKMFGDGDEDLKSVSLQLVYQGQRQVDNRATAVFLVSRRLKLKTNDGVHIYIETAGDYLIDVLTGWPVALETQGMLKIEGEQTNEIGDKIVILAVGPVSLKKRIEYVFEKKKRF
ncbi:MAG: hypothetical protein P1V97_24055 [Planctomycetota bacterium]|nr:hypothetical protein [Planctomycetota bacterium]